MFITRVLRKSDRIILPRAVSRPSITTDSAKNSLFQNSPDKDRTTQRKKKKRMSTKTL